MRSTLPLLALATVLGASATADAPAQATFEVRQEFAVKLPDGAHEFRFWASMPQDDPAQKVVDFKVEAPFPHRVERDSEGNQVLYLEAKDAKEREFKIVETFKVTRSEVRTSPSADAAGVLTDEDRAKVARWLEPNA